MLTIRGACRRIGMQTLFHDLDIDLPRGRCVAVVGPNGVGKSTLLRCVLDEDVLDEGSISVDGSAPDDRSVGFRRAVAAELGDRAVFFDATLAEHLRLRAASYGLSVDAHAVLSDAGIGDLADRYPHTLSTGQRQRFALSSVFMLRTGLLVLDEPERGLDADGQDWLANKVLDAAAADRAILIATHSETLTARCADQTLELTR
ncbi:ABC transporter ATP-binding protein [Gordonia shandongensis]|uniref:ABC transporter ATP-binding protein n=1 Tax=Gordonia shandongensis TaxID=376351 RepID=UPI000427F023|nr:ATP-binding cassette domain-containing protein [Gordonia shandongensis]